MLMVVESGEPSHLTPRRVKNSLKPQLFSFKAVIQSPAPVPSQPSQNIPDQKLDATAAALDQIADVKENYTKQIEATPNESDKRRLVDDANKALVKAVTDQGLSVEEYTSIMVVAQSDPVVREKILQRMKPSK